MSSWLLSGVLGSPDLNGSNADGEKCSDLRYTLKAKPTRFVGV